MVCSLAKLPEAHAPFDLIVDVLQVIPVLFILLAFVWQAPRPGASAYVPRGRCGHAPLPLLRSPLSLALTSHKVDQLRAASPPPLHATTSPGLSELHGDGGVPGGGRDQTGRGPGARRGGGRRRPARGGRRDGRDYSTQRLSADAGAREEAGRALARVAACCEAFFGDAQDVEGCFSGDGGVTVVQSRPQPGG